MKNRLFSFFIFVSLSLTSISVFSEKISLADIQKINPAAASFQSLNSQDSFSEIYSSKGSCIGYYVDTRPYCKEIRGFRSSVPFLIGLDKEKKISSIILLEHKESAKYIRKLYRNKFFDQFIGVSFDKAPDKKYDTVTGATRSSSAIIRSLVLRLSMIEEFLEEAEDESKTN